MPARARVQLLPGFLHDVGLDPTSLLGIPDEQAMIAEEVDHSWHAARVPGDRADCSVREDAVIARARDAKAPLNVLPSLAR